MTDFEKQMAFIMELDKIKKITRQTYLSDEAARKMMRNIPGIWH